MADAHPKPSTALRIATRQSPLALWQAEHVKSLLERAWPDTLIELVPMTTAGDQLLDRSLAGVGGKGLFVKELEQALLENRADLAVHSMKDVPAHLPAGLCLTAYLAGEDPRDALVSNRYAGLDALPPGAVVGTASLRRQSQLRRLRPDLELRELRGNVGTRLRKLDAGEFDAILLAHAGLARLGLGHRIRQSFDPEIFVPAVAQGVIGIECRADDAYTRERAAALHDSSSGLRLAAERAFNARLGGACTVPVAGYAVIDGGKIHMTGLVAAPDGSRLVRDQMRANVEGATDLGIQLARRLLQAGAAEILHQLGVTVAADDGKITE